VYGYIYVCTLIYNCVSVCVFVGVYTYVYTYMNMHIYISILMYLDIDIDIYTHILIYSDLSAVLPPVRAGYPITSTCVKNLTRTN